MSEDDEFREFFDTSFSKTPHCLVRVIDRTISLAAQSCLRVILDRTISWWQIKTKISIEDFRESTGIKSDTTVRRALEELEEKKLIHMKDHGRYEHKSYGINIRTFQVIRAAQKVDTPSPP